MGGEAGEMRGIERDKGLIKGLYAIVDTSLVPPRRVGAVAEQLIEGGAEILQLRAKGLAGGEFLALARILRKFTSDKGVLFIVNDRVDIAMASGADGVHLGQSDIPVEGARRLLGDRYIIGLSTHNLAEAAGAEGTTADYVSFGPVFITATKENAEPPLGTLTLKQARALVKKPLVAIGGITAARLHEVLSCGVDAVALISDILLCDEPAEKVRSIKKVIKESLPKV